MSAEHAAEKTREEAWLRPRLWLLLDGGGAYMLCRNRHARGGWQAFLGFLIAYRRGADRLHLGDGGRGNIEVSLGQCMRREFARRSALVTRAC